MLNFVIEHGGAARSDLPTLVKLNNMLREEAADKPAAQPAPPTEASSRELGGAPPPQDREKVVEQKLPSVALAMQSMLDFLISPAVCEREGIDRAAFPTLSMLAAQLTGDDTAGTLEKACMKLEDTEAAAAAMGRGEEAEGGEMSNTATIGEAAAPPPSLPMTIPLPIVPSAKDWGVTHTVTVAPPPPPPATGPPPPIQPSPQQQPDVRPLASLTLADLSSELPTPIHRKQQQQQPEREERSHSRIEVIATPDGTQTRREDETAMPTAVGGAGGRPQRRVSRPASAMVAGDLPRNVAAALRQRRASGSGGGGGGTVSSNPPVKRAPFIERYMEKLYARVAAAPAADGGASGTERPLVARPQSQQPQRHLRETSTDPTSYAEVVAHLSRSPVQSLHTATLPSDRQTRLQSLPRAPGSSSGGRPLRFAFDQQLQQYQQLPRVPSVGRPVSAAPLLPALHAGAGRPGRNSHSLMPSQLQSSPGRRAAAASGADGGGPGGLDLTIVGSRLDIPSPMSTTRPAGRYLN